MNRLIIFLLVFFISSPSFALIEDEVAKELPQSQLKPDVYLNYNYESIEKYSVKLKSMKNILSEKELYEGQVLDFKVSKDIHVNDNKIIKRGTKASAKVSAIITPGMNGIPASIILSDFRIEDIDKNKLSAEYEIFGQDRCLLVYPLKWALTILPPAGSLTNFIMGGHAKIKTNRFIEINYYPQWI